ncbi:MAG TPA: biotin/lipoyl-binding protein, partial [Nitrospirota bacterium]|nr:biotin/lipoyl-binding protein [Nitrospirota bacterium]
MPKPRRMILLVAVLAAVSALVYYFIAYRKEAGPEPVQTTGVVEALETNISAKIPGKLRYVAFREGDAVKRGDLIAELESEDLDAALAQARSAVRVEEDALTASRDVQEGARAQVRVARAEVEDARAKVSRADAQLDLADKDFGRAEELFSRGVTAKADIDRAGTQRDTARAEHRSAQAGLELAKSRLSAANASLRKTGTDVKTQGSRVAQAKDAARLAQARLSDTKIHSPVDAVVEYRSLEPGEVVSPGTGILTLIDLSGLWVRIDLEQRFAQRVRPGSKA